MKEGESLMVAIRNKDGSITTDRDKIVERAAEIYRELYSSTTDRPTTQTSAKDFVPEVLSAEVQHAVKQRGSTRIVTEWLPIHLKRKKARSKMRWEDDIKKYIGVTWMRVARD